MPSGWGYAAIPGRRFSFGGPTLDLLSAASVRSHPRLSRLGPAICTPGFDAELALARIRADDPARGLGDALLDQRSVAGIGNLWKVEACWLAEIDPWRPLTRIGDEEILAVLAEARRRDSTANGRHWRFKRLYGTAGRPCPRCGERVRVRRQGDARAPNVVPPGLPALTARPVTHVALGAERAGFEPARELAPPTRLAGECLQPLGHLSGSRDCMAELAPRPPAFWPHTRFDPLAAGTTCAVEVPGPATPDQPMPGGPPSVPEPSPSPMPGEPGRPGVPEPSPPTEPEPGRPDVPEPDPKGPETPDAPIEPEPQVPPETDPAI